MSDTTSVLVFEKHCHICTVPPMHCEKKRIALLAMSDRQLHPLQEFLLHGDDTLNGFPEGVQVCSYELALYFRGKLERGLTSFVNNTPTYFLFDDGKIIRQVYGIPSSCPALEGSGAATVTEITYTPCEP